MLPVSLHSSNSSSVASASIRWLTSLLFVMAVAVPCTLFFRAAAPSVSFLLSIREDPRPPLVDLSAKWTEHDSHLNAELSSSTPAKASEFSSSLPVRSEISEKPEVLISVPEKSESSSSIPEKSENPSSVPDKVEISSSVPAISEISSSVPEKSEIPSSTAITFGELESEDIRLERVLKAAAMEDKSTVILTTSNAAWAAPGSIIDLFLESFRNGHGTEELLKHLVIVAFDPQAYDRCKSIHPHCFALVTEGVDFTEERSYMSDGYLQLVWRKLDILRLVLSKGYNFIFSDADVMWFRNPLPHFDPDADFQASCDKFVGDPMDLRNEPNTGFKYVKANNRTIAFYDFWYSSREKLPGKGQQGVFNEIKFDPYVKEIGVTFKFLTDDVFSGLCDPSRHLDRVSTMHATCCIGLAAKVHDLEILRGDWRTYTSLPESLRQERHYMWSELQLICRYLG